LIGQTAQIPFNKKKNKENSMLSLSAYEISENDLQEGNKYTPFPNLTE